MQAGPSVQVNGEARPVDDGTSVARLVAQVAPSTRGVAVAVNGEVVPRSTWETTTIVDGDRIEILGAAQGG